MKKIIIGFIVAATLIFSSCSTDETTETPKAIEKKEKVDTHQKALDKFNNAVKEYNKKIAILCECYKEAGDAYGCERKHGYPSFIFPSDEEVGPLSDQINSAHIQEGNKKLKECKAEGLKNASQEEGKS